MASLKEDELKQRVLRALQKICDDTQPHTDDTDNSVCSRICFRPSMNKISLQDAKWEAVEIAFQFFLQNDVPVWMSLFLASRLVEDRIKEILMPFQSDKEISLSGGVESEDDKEIQIAGGPFAKAVIENLLAVCKTIVPDGSFTFQMPSCLPFRHVSSASAVRNQRRKMEDRHVVIPSLELLFPNQDLKGDSLYAVFDGHAGSECANYAATHLIPNLIFSPSFHDKTSEALCQVFAETDRCLCCKCEKEDEYRRIESSGGMVLCVQGELRVNGVLNVSRSLGDAILKPIISSEPSVHEVDLTGSEYYLVLASDGLWDCLSTDECAECVKDFVHTHSVKDAEQISGYLVQRAKDNGSLDNITSIFVYLKPPDELWRSFNV